MWCTNMKAALATSTDIFPTGAANTGGSQRATRSPEWATSCPNLILEASRTPGDYVTLLGRGRMLKSVRGPTRYFHERQIISALCGGCGLVGWALCSSTCCRVKTGFLLNLGDFSDNFVDHVGPPLINIHLNSNTVRCSLYRLTMKEVIRITEYKSL
jgi:hypothetical protein